MNAPVDAVSVNFVPVKVVLVKALVDAIPVDAVPVKGIPVNAPVKGVPVAFLNAICVTTQLPTRGGNAPKALAAPQATRFNKGEGRASLATTHSQLTRAANMIKGQERIAN